MKKILLSIVTISLLSACVTQKKKGDIGAVKQFYHNTTAKYNGYFNANELVKGAVVKLNEQHRDNYNQILDLYEYVAVDNPGVAASDLDAAIKKVSVVVSLHREAVWTDDCYLLMGKAQYLKQDYESAEETLRFMKEEFNPENAGRRVSGGKKSSKRRVYPSRKKSSKKKSIRKKSSRKKASRKKSSRKKVSRSKSSRSKTSASRSSRSKLRSKEPVVKRSKDDEISSSNRQNTPEEKGESYFLKHRPAYQEGLLWLARVLLEREYYDEAKRMLNELENDPTTFKDLRPEIAAAQAYYHLKQKQYERAISPLEKALELSGDREQKARYAYIMAQIHQKNGRTQDAYASFEQALKYSTDYEMEFSAALSLTKNALANGRLTMDQAVENLNKMLKDFKNIEYKDQIYFTLADIALMNGKRPEGIEYLKKSVYYNQNNAVQKSESYLKLAQLFFEEEAYVHAKNYYDSTLQVMPKNDERFPEAERYSKDLTDIAANIQIITLQDSLLRISRMDDAGKRELAFEIMKERQRQQELARKAAAAKKAPPKAAVAPAQRLGAAGRSATGGQPSNFFAYNDRSVKKGKRDFDRKWGNRPLEDNWRRSNKRGLSGIDGTLAGNQATAKEISDVDVEKILKDVPKTPEQVAAANDKIREAQFKLGTLYRDRLQKDRLSVVTLEEMLRRYPENDHELDAWYYLYLGYTDLKNSEKAQQYLDKIVGKYPNTTQARVLSDPSYVQEATQKEKELTHYYDETYEAFRQRQYQKAYDRINKVTQLYGPQNTLQPKFALLSAMCVGNLEGKNAYKEALKDIVARYPQTPEQIRAKEMLRLLDGLPGSSVGASAGNSADGKTDGTVSSIYKAEDDKVHYFLVILDEKSKLNDAKIGVSDFNKKYHSLLKLRVSNIYLSDTPLLVVRRFKNKADGMSYYNSVSKNQKEFMPEGLTYQYYIVTQNNYRQILKSKSVEGYEAFFKAQYLK